MATLESGTYSLPVTTGSLYLDKQQGNGLVRKIEVRNQASRSDNPFTHVAREIDKETGSNRANGWKGWYNQGTTQFNVSRFGDARFNERQLPPPPQGTVIFDPSQQSTGGLKPIK